MNDKFNNKDWFNYIIKLNDRELSRKASSGFTSWAIMGLFAYLFFKVIDNFTIIYMNKDLTIIFCTICFNLIFSIVPFIVLITKIFDYEKENRVLLSRTILRIIEITVTCSICLFIINFLLNLYCILNNTNFDIHKWTYYFFCVEIVAMIALFLFIIRYLKNANKDLKNSLVRLNTNMGQNQNMIVTLLLLINGIISMLVFIFQIMPVVNLINENLIIFKVSIWILGILFCIFLFIYLNAQNIRNSWLLDLERQIIIKDLSTEEINNIFTREFIGQDTINWLENIEIEFKSVVKELDEEYKVFKSKYVDNYINSDLSLEEKVKVMKSNDCYLESLLEVCEKYGKFVDIISRELDSFALQGELMYEEKMIIKNFQSNFKENTLYYDELIDDIKKKCANAENEIKRMEEILNNYPKSCSNINSESNNIDNIVVLDDSSRLVNGQKKDRKSPLKVP